MKCWNKNKVKIKVKIDYVGILKQDTSTLFSGKVGGGIRITEDDLAWHGMWGKKWNSPADSWTQEAKEKVGWKENGKEKWWMPILVRGQKSLLSTKINCLKFHERCWRTWGPRQEIGSIINIHMVSLWWETKGNKHAAIISLLLLSVLCDQTVDNYRKWLKIGCCSLCVEDGMRHGIERTQDMVSLW